MLKLISLFLFLSLILIACSSKPKNSATALAIENLDTTIKVGGPFENSEFMLMGMPMTLKSVDTSQAWYEAWAPMVIEGRILSLDNKTPVAGVILYYYHTNNEGKYMHRPAIKRSMPPNAEGQTHGYIRGWVKSDTEGRYTIFTSRPATYPSRDFPAHIHASIKEPNNKSEYYIDDFIFSDDPLVTENYKSTMEKRGGDGLMQLVKKNGIWYGQRDIILGENIPDYK